MVQSDLFAGTDFITVALITHESADSPVRIPLDSDAETGLSVPSCVMADKLQTLPRGAFGKRIGSVPAQVMTDVGRAIITFLDIFG